MLKIIYLIHHSHTDLGYTHSQPVVRHLHCRYIDAALREIGRTRDYPDGARMRWTCETLYPVFDWLRQASDEDKKIFTSFEREGLLEVTGCWEIVTQSSPPRAWQWMLDRVEQARTEYGFTIRSAMLSDINGAPWALPDLLSSHGIGNFSMSINEHFGKSIFPRLKPFRWRGPEGGVLNTFNGLHYNNNQYFGVPYDLERARRGIEEFREFLSNYPGSDREFAVFQVTRPDFNDNGAPDPRLPDFVRSWNEAGLSPRMEIVTLSGFFDAIGKGVFECCPELSGEWTDFWNFGATSTPYETALNRRAYGLLEEVEALSEAGAASLEISRLVDASLESAIFHDEHTWGADSSVSAPQSDASRAGLHFKNDFAFRAHTTALLARAEALSGLIDRITPHEAGQNLFVFNPSDSPCKTAIEIPVPWLLSDVCPTTTHLHRMQHLPISWPPATVAIPSRPAPEAFQPDGHLRLALELAPREIRVLSADTVFTTAIPIATSVRKVSLAEVRLENTRFSVLFDPLTGGLASIRRTSDGKELLGQGEAPNAVPLREHPEGGSRREIYPAPDWTKFMGYKGWNTQWIADRESAAVSGDALLETSTGRSVLRQEFSSPYTKSVSVAVSLDDAIEAIGIEVTIDFVRCVAPCAWYLPLYFALANPIFTYDNCGIPVQLGRDQLPGANLDYQTVHRWIRIADGAESVLIFTPDTPVACLGGFRFGRMISWENPAGSSVAPMLHSNYWDTNYAASCDGSVTFRFYVAFGESAPTDETANQLSARLAHPPIVVPFAGR